MGDTDIVKEGGGSHSVRATRLGGTVTFGAARKIVEQDVAGKLGPLAPFEPRLEA